MTDIDKQQWERVFKQHGRVFTEIQEDIPEIYEQLRHVFRPRVLDLGSGTGRHVVYFAQRGCEVYGLDISQTGVTMTQKWLRELGLRAFVQQGDMSQSLPYETNFFDAVVSIQVIHHGRLATVKSVIAELERVLKPGGVLLITVPTRRDQATAFEQIEPNTFVPLDGWEKGLPHHYFSEASLRDAFCHFDIQSVTVDKTGHFALLGVLMSDLEDARSSVNND